MQNENRSFSLGLLKPDCEERGLVEKILVMISDAGLEIVAIKRLLLTTNQIDIFYKRCKNDDYFDAMSSFLRSGYVTAYIVHGDDAIGRLNKLVGFNEPSKALQGTIRSLGIDIRRNLAHSSENREDFLNEATIIFGVEELEQIGAL